MSLLSAIVLPRLEKELIAMEPEAANFFLQQLKETGSEVMAWLDSKGKAAADTPVPSSSS